MSESATPAPAPRTLTSAFRDTVARMADQPALRSSDGRVDLTWAEYAAIADRIAAGLAHLGVGRGDTVALLIGNRPEWQLTDTGVLVAGATPFSLYTSAPAEQNADLLARSGAKVMVADAELLEGLTPPEGVHIVEVGGPGVDRTSFEQLQTMGDSGYCPPPVEPDDLATLIFTSGTTGPPKGVELTHASILFMVDVFDSVQPLRGGRTVSYLPHAHVVDRIVGHYFGIVGGSSVTTVDRPAAIFDELPGVRPTLFTSVPRIWQRLHAGIVAEIRGRSEKESANILGAIAEAQDAVEMRLKDEPVPKELSARVVEADRRWFGPLRRSVGLDEVGWFITGSAPLPRATHIFFAAIGMPLHDLWGLSETVAVATMSVPGDHHIGTVGCAVPGTEVRLAEDREVLIRGPHLARGYKDDPEATARAFDVDGWFHSGDIGEWRGDQLAIVDRKKEIMISAGGENMSPARIESVIADVSPLIASVVIVGDGRAFNVALIVPDFVEVAESLGVNGPPEVVVEDPLVMSTFAHVVDTANERLSRAERVRRHVLLTAPWSTERGEVTPTLKLRRKVVESNHAEAINQLYVAAPENATDGPQQESSSPARLASSDAW